MDTLGPVIFIVEVKKIQTLFIGKFTFGDTRACPLFRGYSIIREDSLSDVPPLFCFPSYDISPPPPPSSLCVQVLEASFQL